MSYEITKVRPLANPVPLQDTDCLIVAQFDLRIGPVELRRCVLTRTPEKGSGLNMPSRSVKLQPAVRSEIKGRVRVTYLATVDTARQAEADTPACSV